MSFKDGTMKFVPECQIINKKNNDAVIECDHIEVYEPRSTTPSSIRILAQYTSRAMLKLAEFAASKKEGGEEELSAEEQSEGERMKEISEKSFLDRTDEEHAESSDFLAKQLHMSCEALCDIGFLGDFVNAFKKVILERSGTKSVAVLFYNFEQTPVNQRIFESLDPSDQEKLATVYCAFFGIGLLGSQKNGSKSAPEQPTEVKVL